MSLPESWQWLEVNSAIFQNGNDQAREANDMCGIVAAVAEREVSGILLEGLKRLEYAGVRALSFQSLDPDVDESSLPYVLPLADYNFKSEPSRHGDSWLLGANVMVMGRSEGP
ncbi:MAG: hypothetical protein IIC60_13465, partial [Proteobacteria bacterium]|nr:hypothetical protein [Pseudomonadota bacterium]